jgi:hypothetical protein
MDGFMAVPESMSTVAVGHQGRARKQTHLCLVNELKIRHFECLVPERYFRA